MRRDSNFTEYEPVTRRGRAPSCPEDDADSFSFRRRAESEGAAPPARTHEAIPVGPKPAADGEALREPPTETRALTRGRGPKEAAPLKENWLKRRGHALSYLGLFLFTAILYFRPYELIASLSSFTSMALVVAIATLVIFFPSQLLLEGNLSVRPRELNLLLLLCVTALLSIPTAISPVEAFNTFTDAFIKAVLMFVVMINVVRTSWRLKGLLFLGIAVSVYLSFKAIEDYQSGNLTVEGYRVAGSIGGMFSNPNDMALHLVTIFPIAIALMFTTRGVLRKFLYGASAVLMVAGVVVTFSRGGFLSLIGVAGVLGWKIGRKHRLTVAVCMLVSLVAFMALAPGNYGERLGSIFDHSRDAVGSAGARQELLIRSIQVALRHPLFGVGMGNFHIVSIKELVSHNAYTQVAAEMGLAATALYVMFMLTPFKRLRAIERETFAGRHDSRFYYLAIGFQASLVGYMIASFFASVAYLWYVYYLVGYSICLRRMYQISLDAQRERAAAGNSGVAAADDRGTDYVPARALQGSGAA
jgi:O-antigen ligase